MSYPATRLSVPTFLLRAIGHLDAVRLTPTAIALAAVFAGLSHAHADDSATPATNAAAVEKLDRVTVTGSNIRRTDAETPSPVQVITSEELQKSGSTSISEVLRGISANNQGTLSQSFNGAFANGGSGIALRGLTVGSTLVLIDGHRTAPYPLADDGQRSFVDITSIPFDAVERIEVLKDGASAIYGSDAIAGVVNIILKKSFKGTRINVDAGVSMFGDGGTQHLSISHGFGDLATDNHAGYFTVEYRHQAPILVVNRAGLSNRDYTAYGGLNITPGVANSANTPTPASLGGYTINSAGANTVITPLPGTCTATNAYGLNCPFFNSAQQIQPDTHNINLLGKFTQNLANDWTATLQGSVFSSSAEQVVGLSGSNYLLGGLVGITGGPSIAAGTYPGSAFQTVVPSTGEFLQTTFTGIGPLHNLVDSQTYRLVAEATGPLGDWEVSGSAGFAKAILHSRINGDLYIPGVAQLLQQNPTATAAQLNAILQSPANTGILSPVANATDTSELDFIAMNASRELMKLPGGPLAVSLGLDYTHHAVNAAPSSGIQQGLYNLAGNTAGVDAFAVGEQDIAAAYVEFNAAILKNLEVDVAGRVDSVNTYGTSTTPKFGIKYTPIEQLSLRGTYSEGFRAPNSAESGNAGTAFFYTSVQDPVLCAGGKTAVGSYPSQCNVVPTFFQGANHNLKPERSDSFTLGLVFEPVAGFSLATDYYRIRLLDQITSSINAYPVSSLVSAAVRGAPGQILPQVIDANGNTANVAIPQGLILYIPTPYVNAPTIQTDGLDINLRARFNLHDYGMLTSDLNITQMLHYKLSVNGTTVDLAGTHGPSGIGGDTGTPKTRASWNWTWTKGPAQLATNVNYVSGINVTDPAAGLTDCQSAILFNGNGSFTTGQTVNPGVCRVASFTTFDFTGRYAITPQWSLRAAVINAFNRAAPLDLQTYGGSNYNPSLHQAGAVGRYFQVGSTYDF